MVNIILCGGSGTRLWPLSRTLMPKQFIKLFINETSNNDFDTKSLFQLTVERNSKFCNKNIIAVNTEQYFLALDQIEGSSTFLLEPIGKNTAPAITLACMALPKDKIVLVTPSDHLIKNEIKYQEVIKLAQNEAQKDNLVTFGIIPTHPETGFGYIEANGTDVVNFHEKPDIKTAQKYIQTNNQSITYYWNSGMFMFKAGVFLEEIQKYSPKIYDTCKIAFDNKKIQDSTFKINQEDMQNIPSNSIDYAVMEKSKKVKVIHSDIDWSDVGSFDSLIKEIDSYEALEIDSKNNFYHTDTKDKIALQILCKS